MCLVPSFPTNTLAVSPNSTNVALPDPTVTVNGGLNTADIQITAFGGTVSLDTTGVTVTAGDGTDDQAITINGDNAALQTALATLTFTPTNGLVGEDQAHVQLSSTGAANSRLEIILTNAPFITLPSAPNVAEDSSNVAFGSTLNIDDATGDNQTVTLTATGGTFSIGNNAGLSYSVGNGFANTTATFSGSLTNINNALDTLVFTPTSNLNGTGVASVRVQSDDGNGGTDDETLTFDVSAVNDAPVIALPSLPTVNEDDTSVAVLDPGFPNTLLGITDVENDTLTATVTSTGGTFAFTSTGGVSFTSGTFAGPNTTAVISGSPAAIRNAIQSINFAPTANLNGTGAGAIRIQVDDGNGGNDDETLTFDIVAVNDDPVITLPSAPAINEDDTNVNIAVGATDVESDNLTVTLTVKGGVVNFTSAGGISFTTGNSGQTSLKVFSGTIDAVNNALQHIQFTPTTNLNGVNAASIRIQADDGNGGTSDQTLNLSLAAVNDVPAVSTLPATVTVTEDALSSVDLSTTSISDIDSSSVTLTLTASAGVFATPADGSAGGVTATLVDTSTITLFGSAASINAYLDTASNIQYTSLSNSNGMAAATITVTINDGDGSGDITVGTVNIDITAVNDLPTSSGSSITMAEDTSRTLTVSDFNFSDVDTADSLQSVRIDTLTVGSGTFRLSGTDVTSGQVITTADITAGNLVYTPAADANGTGLLTFTYSVNDGTAFAASPASFAVNVTDVPEPVREPINRPIDEGDTVGGTQSGTSFNDRIGGTGGRDTISGGNGADTLIGGEGDDFVAGGNGNDIAFAGANDDGEDTLQGNAGNDILGGGAGDDIIVGGTLSFSVSLFNSGNSGDDTLFGGAGNDLIVAGSYNTSSMEVINTGQGTNTIWAGTGNDTVFGDDNRDTLGGGVGGDRLDGGSGDDTIYGGAGNDNVNAGADNDLSFSGAGSDTLNGGSGDDTLFGGAGNDMVSGGEGADRIWAGAGNDDLSGGEGADTFVFGRNSGNDTVTDFDAGEDTIDLVFAPTDFESLADVQAAASNATQNGQSGVLIDLGNDQSVFIIGISTNDLTASNVSF